MKLVAFEVSKYRSISATHRIRVDRQTILVGPNNEGKSNLLRALVTAMRVLTRPEYFSLGATGPKGGFRLPHRAEYDWDRDYPQNLQAAEPKGQSEITLEFKLSDAEVTAFKSEIKSRLNGALPVRISLARDGSATIRVAKKGPGATTLTKKSTAIAKFVSRRLVFEHIPAVRTASAAQEIVAELLERELSALEREPAYAAALDAIATLQQPILTRLSESLKATLVKFLPDVRDVSLQIPREERYRALRRSCRVDIDDGISTPLQLKGDGVQSLAALAIMRHASDTQVTGRNLVLAIEEPESHLHPHAIHALRGVLSELSARHQIVVTTHNPLFIDRGHLSGNIIVQDKRARPARNISELRTALGVRAADNLQHAELVLIVEGSDDELALTALLRHSSPLCAGALDGGRLALHPIHGAGNLSYNVGLIRSALCQVHCFLDHDTAATKAFETARDDGLLSDKETHWATCLGSKESELEDLYDPAVYAGVVSTQFGVSLAAPEFKTADKWSRRMAATFRRQSKLWDERVENRVKAAVAEAVAAAPAAALLAAKRAGFDSFVSALELRVKA